MSRSTIELCLASATLAIVNPTGTAPSEVFGHYTATSIQLRSL